MVSIHCHDCRRSRSPNRPVVVIISGHGTIETAVKATKLGAFDFLEKPLTIEKVMVVVKNALQQRKLELEVERLKEEGRRELQIIGESVPMKALRQQLALMAATNGRVLIYGESGTGKELVAHAIHNSSQRGAEAFVEVNCAAIPEDLIESELFGHRKGSFPGATEDKTGKLQKADGGTLFLDEVGDMSLKTQAKVLRSLEEQRFEPVGADTSIQVDVRVVAATNKNLEEEIERGQFSRGSVLSAQRDSVLCAAAARSHRGHSAIGESLPEGIHHCLRTASQGADTGSLRGAQGTSLAGQRARAAQSDGAHRHYEPANPHRCAPHPADSRQARGL